MAGPTFRVVKVDTSHEDNALAIRQMHHACFPDLELQQLHGDWWIVRDHLKTPVAFAGLWPSLTTPGAGYLCRAGVMPAGRGHGIQRRLIRIREREAKRKRWVAVLSDVDPKNAHSMNNLFACGFKSFRPSAPWCGDEWVYMRKIIEEGVA
jgi:GNAT superfamily N-acetyltransferase